MPITELSYLNLVDGEDKISPFKNCLRNNYKHIRKWAKRTQTNCFRLYDRQIKEFPLYIDYYNGRFYVQALSSQKGECEISQEVKKMVSETLLSLFPITEEAIFWRVRMRRSKLQQYEKSKEGSSSFFTVYEYGTAFKVNLSHYLDTGLFLDHRQTRQMVAKLSKGKTLLNLFAYTASFSVQAAKAGAKQTTSVDLSNTYTKWASLHFKMNGLDLKANRVIRADCLTYLDDEIAKKNRYDLIVIDPPTLSRSKKMASFFDLQRDHVVLIQKALTLLSPKGCLFFSTNARKFHFDESSFTGYIIHELSSKSIPIDFHNKKIHRLWTIKLHD